MTEVRITSETGGQKGKKPAQLASVDPIALLELAKVSGFGAEKYDTFNYLRGYDWSLSADAALRHLLAFLAGEDLDEESGLPHTAHFAWHGLALTSFLLRGVGTDNRVETVLEGYRQALEAPVEYDDEPLAEWERELLSGLEVGKVYLVSEGAVHYPRDSKEPYRSGLVGKRVTLVAIEPGVDEGWGIYTDQNAVVESDGLKLVVGREFLMEVVA